MGPNYANLFVGYVEEQIFNQFDGPKPELFGRYIYDCPMEPHSTPKKNWSDLSVLSTLSIRPSNSHGKSPKPQSLFLISTFLSKTIIWQPVFTTNPQICGTVTYCTHLPTHLMSKTQFRTPNFSGSVDSAATLETSAIKHHIPQTTNIPYQPLLIKSIFSVLAHAEKQFFSKLVSVQGK